MDQNQTQEQIQEQEQVQEQPQEQTAPQEPTYIPESTPKIPAKAPAEKPKLHGVALAAIICAGVGFFFNPLSLVLPAAIVLGIIGLIITKGTTNKLLSGLGLGIGVVAMAVQFIVDLLLSVFTFGLSFLI